MCVPDAGLTLKPPLAGQRKAQVESRAAEARGSEITMDDQIRKSKQWSRERFEYVVYGLAVVASLSTWFLAVRAPLWLDETASYWSIDAGFRQIWTRAVENDYFPAYFYILGLTNAVFGSREIVLRMPSILAMIAAVYVFYRCAREWFAPDVALIATVVFVLDARVVFAAIDVRPYAFALLVTNLAILSFLRWLKTERASYAALFGMASAGIFYFHYLFGCIMAAFVVAYVIDRWPSPFRALRQVGVAAGCFVALIVPVWSGLWFMEKTRGTHVFASAPPVTAFLRSVGPGALPYIVAGAVLLAALLRALSRPSGRELRQFAMCAAWALVPLGILYVATVNTALHVFIERYQTVAVPGIALSWAWMVSRIDSRRLRVVCCVVLVAWIVTKDFITPTAGLHGYSWKYALEVADAEAGKDGAPLLICSDLPEADYQSMPMGAPSDSILFAPLSYYKVHVPVIPLPRSLNEQTESIGRSFFLRAAVNRERFFVLAFRPSYSTLDWLINLTAVTHVPRVLGDFEGVAVVEFDPR